MRLSASHAVTDDRLIAAQRTPSRQQMQGDRGHPGSVLAFSFRQCDKKNQGWREGPPLFNALPRFDSGRGSSPSGKVSFERQKNIAS
jgi:hypothetical protein